MTRFCALGSACDMFAYEKESTGIKCRYFPHMSLKDKNILDFFSPTNIYGDQDFRIFFLNCKEGLGANLAKGSDLVSATLEEDWSGESREIFLPTPT